MADTVPPPDAQRRPAVVTVAVWLLVVVAILEAVTALVTVSQLGTLRDAYDKLFADTQVKNAGTGVAVVSAAAIALALLFALGFVVLAIFVGRGKNPARIITWVVAAFSICCAGTNLASTAIGFNGNFGNPGDGPSNEEIQRTINDALPSWYNPLLTTITVLSLAALVTTVILLALPIANPYFRKRQQQWQPPVPPPTA
jgi:hypothetical protein